MNIQLCTPWLAVNILLFLGGFWILIKGSDLFVDASSDLARAWHVPELVIGLTFVSIGTSLPELASSLYAAFANQPDFIIGNIAGSITTNITLILGTGIAMSGTLMFPRKLLTRDAVLMNLVLVTALCMTLLARATAPDGTMTRGLDRLCGAILFLGAIAYCAWLFFMQKEENPENPKVGERKHGVCFLLLLSILSLLMIALGSQLLVDNVVWGAERIGISQMLISATIVAFGTSVPELAVTIIGVRKGKHDLALGNIIGSNIFNVLMIFGLCAIIRPLAVIGASGIVNILMMVAAGIILFLLMLVSKGNLKRGSGFVLLFLYLLFLLYNGRELFLR